MSTPKDRAALIEEQKQRIEKVILQKLQRGEHSPEYDYFRLHNGIPLTQHYNEQMPIPRTPIFHPYNIDEATPKGGVTGIPGTAVSIRLTDDFLQFLTPAFKAAYNTLLVKLKQKYNIIELYFVTQTMPWIPQDGSLLFRPHYWVHGLPQFEKGIASGKFNEGSKIQHDIGVFSTSGKISIDGAANALASKPIIVGSHQDSAEKRPRVICSPKDVGVLRGIDFEGSQSFYSIISTTEGKPRIAITLHWLVNFEDQKILSEISKTAESLPEFILAIEHQGAATGLNAPNGPLHDLKTLLNVTTADLLKKIGAQAQKEVKGKSEHDEVSRELQFSSFLLVFDDLSKQIKQQTENLHQIANQLLDLEERQKANSIYAKIDEVDSLAKKIRSESETVNTLKELLSTLTPSDFKGVQENAQNAIGDFQNKLNAIKTFVKKEDEYLQGAIATRTMLEGEQKASVKPPNKSGKSS